MTLTGMSCAAVFAALLLLTAGGGRCSPAQPPVSGAPTTAASSTSGQQTRPPSMDARVVDMAVIVRDRKGALVHNFTKDDFMLQVDGHAQTIRYFTLDTDHPLTLGILVDTSMGQHDSILDERTASSAFLDEMLAAPGDRDKAFVVQFAGQTDLLQDVTSSKSKLQAALKQLDATALGDKSGVTSIDSDSSGSGRARRSGTTLYDALFLSSDELLSKQTGRKVLIILSSGNDSGSKESFTSSVEAAQRADTIVYAIYFKSKDTDRGFHVGDRSDDGGYPGGGYPGGGYPGGGYPGGGYPGGGYPGGGGQRQPGIPIPDGKKILQRMADETGGRLFEVGKKQTVADIYKQIAEELRGQYRLGYTPDEKAVSDGYHRVDVSLTKPRSKDFFIQTRDGYYTGK